MSFKSTYQQIYDLQLAPLKIMVKLAIGYHLKLLKILLYQSNLEIKKRK